MQAIDGDRRVGAVRDVAMRMAGATGHIFNIFHVSLLDTVIPFFGSLEEAQARA